MLDIVNTGGPIEFSSGVAAIFCNGMELTLHTKHAIAANNEEQKQKYRTEKTSVSHNGSKKLALPSHVRCWHERVTAVVNFAVSNTLE